MYAIVDIAGQQFKVEKNQKLYVHRLEEKEGAKVTFDKVLLVDDNGKVSVGSPVVNGTVVKATVVSHLKGDKVIVFKKKRRKGYKKKNGHRQYLTELTIDSIGAGKATAKKETAKAEPKKEEVKAEEPKKAAPKKAAAKKPVAKKPAAEKKEAAPKKEAAKKPAAKKPAAKKAAPKKEDKAE